MDDYKFKTTFWMDFSIADRFGADAVRDTYKRAMLWKEDVEYLAELVLVLNWKCWQHYENNRDLSELYGDLYYQTNDYAYDTLKGEDLQYYYRTTD